MHKFILTTIIAIGAMNGLYAQDTVQIEPKVELKLIWEREFKSPIWDYVVTIGKKGEPSVKVISFVTEEGKKALAQFFHTEGKLSKSVEGKAEYYGSRVLISKDSKYIGVSTVVKGDPEFIYKVDFDVYDCEGNYIWGRKGLNARPFRLLSNGNLLSYEGFDWQKFTLHNKNGTITELIPIEAEGTGAVDVSRNDFIVFNVHDVNKNEGYVVLYNGTGKQIWRKKFEWRHTSKVIISDYGEYIAATGKSSDGRNIFIISNKGDLLWQFPSGNCASMDFSPDTKYLVASINLNHLHLFESATGKILWNYKLENNRSFYSLSVSQDGEYVVSTDGGGRGELPGGNTSIVFLFNKKGNIIWQKELQIQPERAPSVRFTDDGKYLLICNSNRLYCYKIVRGGQ